MKITSEKQREGPAVGVLSWRCVLVGRKAPPRASACTMRVARSRTQARAGLQPTVSRGRGGGSAPRSRGTGRSIGGASSAHTEGKQTKRQPLLFPRATHAPRSTVCLWAAAAQCPGAARRACGCVWRVRKGTREVGRQLSLSEGRCTLLGAPSCRTSSPAPCATHLYSNTSS